MERYLSFRIDRRDFFRGHNAYDSLGDGGMKSGGYYGLNIWKKPGYLATAADFTQKTTGLQRYSAISMCANTGTGVGMNVMALGANVSQDGYFYSVDSVGVFTLQTTETGKDFAAGFSDTKFYDAHFYTTSKTDIAENGLNMLNANYVASWWVTTKGKTALSSTKPHPINIFGDIMYVADGQYLHENDHGTCTEQVFDLGAGQVITAITNYSNLQFMAVDNYINAGGGYHGQGRLVTWNGYSESYLDEWPVDRRIDTLIVFDGVLFAFTKYYLEYFDGSRFVPIYPLNGSLQVFPSMVAIVDNSLVFADGANLVRYGSPIPGGRKVFARIAPSANGSNDGSQFWSMLAFSERELILTQNNVSNNNGYSSFCADLNDDSALSSYTFQFNPRFFSLPVKLRRVMIETEALSNPESAEVAYTNDEDSNATVGTHNSSSPSVYRRSFDVHSKKATRQIAPSVTLNRGAHLKTVECFYELSENPLNK